MKKYLLALLGGLWLATLACAQQAPVDEDLYLTAMQSIADGRRADASLILERLIARGPQHAGEWLDLAMIQCALGHDADAETLFQRIEREYQPPQGIRDIIRQQREQGCYQWQAQVLWGVNAARGYDSNVNQGASFPVFTDSNGVPLELLPEYKPHSDHYSVVSGDYLRDLNADGDLAFAQAHLRQYDRLSAYNSMSLFVGAEHPWQLSRWQMRSSALLGALTLGGALYQEQAQLQLRAAPPLKLPKGYDFNLLGSVTRTSYKTLANFDSTTLELRNVLGFHNDSSQAQAAFGYQRDLGSAERPGGDRTGWSARLYGRRMVRDSLQAEVELTGQRWSGQNEYSPGLINVARKQNNVVLRTVLSYALRRDQSLQLEWRQVRNRENISIFQYDAHQIQLSWRWANL
ncbi:tetratricopeptide repeat protein [Pseudoduganella sp. FT26W]|uniref:Tetratricopeptide repeat protein n=1 Tax=Duganella aquatilis TaxID=2666082 RepID=A0A844DGD5_9BURK|nr:tetratricopeptide repeat protein [Duganella aquatilis]MRW88266.1 tetratricopeptide repeat protein [Duganella aquatilis]